MSNQRGKAPVASQPAVRAPMLWAGWRSASSRRRRRWRSGDSTARRCCTLGLAAIAAGHVGFAAADGRPRIIAAESSVAFGFVVVAAAAVTGSPWLLVAGLAGHGLKDLWQHRSHLVANTRWWPPSAWSSPPSSPRDRRLHALRLTGPGLTFRGPGMRV